ncbi:MAG: hypothetical protein ACFFD2_00440 [Promethearchaeota archaeon]
MKRSTKEWKRVNIAVEQIEYIEKIIKNPLVKGKYNFQSVPEFVRRAIADFIEKIEKEMIM